MGKKHQGNSFPAFSTLGNNSILTIAIDYDSEDQVKPFI